MLKDKLKNYKKDKIQPVEKEISIVLIHAYGSITFINPNSLSFSRENDTCVFTVEAKNKTVEITIQSLSKGINDMTYFRSVCEKVKKILTYTEDTDIDAKECRISFSIKSETGFINFG